MPPVSTRALVLQSFAYSESSKIVRLFTPAFGLASVIAKGAQRPKSRFGGLLEPFSEGMAAFSRREGRELHTLAGWDLLRSRQELGRNLTTFAGGSLLLELVLRFGAETPSETLYGALVRGLDGLAGQLAVPASDRVVAGSWGVIAGLGYAPQTAVCVVCGRELAPEEDARFHARAGGAACAACRPAGRVLPASVRGELRRMLDGEPRQSVALADPAMHRGLLRVFLREQFAHERPLRSAELFFRHSAEVAA